MPRIGQSIECLAVPQQSDVDPCVERSRHSDERLDRDPIGSAALDP